MSKRKEKHSLNKWAWSASIIIFAVLCGITAFVWKRQTDYQRSLVMNHIEDIGYQASKRIQAFVDSHLKTPMHFQIDFNARNRTWRLTMAPKKELGAFSIWFTNISVPLLGLFLSLSFGFLVFLLFNRMTKYRIARDDTLKEMEERIRTEAALRESELRYRSVFNSTSDGMVVLDQEGRIIEANDAAGKINRYSNEELVGMSMEELIASSHRHLYKELRDQLDKKGSAAIDCLILRKDLGELNVKITGAVFSEQNESRVLAMISDVSEHKKAIERLALLSRKAIAAQEEERARLSMELHDDLGQILTALRLDLDYVKRQLTKNIDKELDVLHTSVDLTEKATDELRRICKGLRPPLLDDLGIEPAIRLLVDEFERRSGISTDLSIPKDEPRMDIPKEVALCAYRVVQESLNNIRKYAQATGVDISLAYTAQGLELSIYDNGVGFDVNKLGEMRGWGLDGMKERAKLVGGAAYIRSVPNKSRDPRCTAGPN